MSFLTNDENWATRERLRRVEFLLWWRGWIGRQDLLESFGISPAQASGDLQRYAGLNPGAMIYQTSRKRYESAEGMTCILHEPSFEEAVRMFLGNGQFSGSMPQREVSDSRLSMIQLPLRRLDIGIARRVLIALLERRTLQVRYHSLSSGSVGLRELSPTGLAWDGTRWHVRAWCGAREDWRDFVLGRMSEATWPAKSFGDLPADQDWDTFESVTLRINPELSDARREALRMDYYLAGDTLELRVRRSMKRYLLASLFIDHQSHLELPRHFVEKQTM
ncbi:WYL domain-containing protein [Luteolibacter sp. GHJ8]|uniref:WYL domain-containing protein n=1 Tax=Luteolibacter rhizosphaerae TaxID=2989719 RepID=A0ABT3G0D1_9BACT|nr:WYL domain-containing protein [Luteolibacter rhizosphaerae]MCW1913044.1 WYL domain-containing protein [Luteolibacter rhizosphaerae]